MGNDKGGTMKKVAIMLVPALILLFALLVAGCGSKEKEATPTPVHTVTATPTKIATTTPAQTQTSIATPTATSTTIKTPTPTSTPIATATSTKTPTSTSTSGKTLADIYGLGKDIGPFKFDQIITSSDTSQTAQTIKAWQKGAWTDHMKMRYEMTTEGENVVVLMDYVTQNYYMYYPGQNMAYKVDISLMPKNPTEGSAQINTTYVSDETIDGKNCSVYQWTQGVNNFKGWIWKDHPLPIKMETTTSGQTTITECKNIVFGDIPDSMFQLPAGVQIQAMPQMPH